jgi:hypothetical protein
MVRDWRTYTVVVHLVQTHSLDYISSRLWLQLAVVRRCLFYIKLGSLLAWLDASRACMLLGARFTSARALVQQ